MAESARKVLAVGAAGKFAGLVVPELVKRGVTVRGMTSSPEHAEAARRNGAAEVAAIALTEDRLLYGTFELAAEGHLDRHGVAAVMAEVLGRDVRAETLPFEEWADKAGIPEEGPVRPGLEQMYAWYDAHGFLGNPLTLRVILGREPRTSKAFFEELASDGQR